MGKYINQNEIFKLSEEEALHALNVSSNGLSTDEAQRRIKIFGQNKLPGPKKIPLLIESLLRAVNPLSAILLIASALSIYRGDMINAGIITIIVILGIFIDYFQNHRALIILKRLQVEFSVKSSVLRNHIWSEVMASDIVPGDIIQLSAGDLVPADAMLLTSNDLHIQQSVLTGESLPIEKTASTKGSIVMGTLSPIQYENFVFSGSSVLSGHATALIFATGKDVLFAEITKAVTTVPPKTEFEIGINQYGFFIFKIIIFIMLFVLLVNVYLKRNILDALLFSVALAVGLTPEFLPMITMVTFAGGAMRLSRKKVIIKNLSAIHNLGSIDVLCSDKTGTITTGEMVLENYLDIKANSSQELLLMAYLNSYYQTGAKNFIDEAILKKVNDSHLNIAIGKNAHSFMQNYNKIDEIPFDFERRRVSVAVRLNEGGGGLLITKGAPEYVFKLCSSYKLNEETLPINSAITDEFNKFFSSMSDQGYRVLAVAYRKIAIKPTYSLEDEVDFVFLGFLIFSDPPLPDSKKVIHLLKEMKVQVKVISGDNERIVQNICQRIGIDSKKVILGSEIEGIPYSLLEKTVDETNLFARVTPNQKQRIVSALRRRGYVVGFVGDGVNDVGSLHFADVGISTSNAADAAKEAANIILLDRSLKVILTGIQEGRRAFGNVMKYIIMSTSSNFGNMLSMAAATLFLPFFPMLPTQILLNNLLFDISQIGVPTDRVDRSFKHKPTHWDINIIRRFMFYIGSVSSVFDFITFYVLLKYFGATEPLFQTGWFIESLATQILVIFVIRSFENPFKNLPSAPLVCTTFFALCAGILMPYNFLGKSFGFVFLPLSYFVFLGSIIVVYLFTVHLIKKKLLN